MSKNFDQSEGDEYKAAIRREPLLIDEIDLELVRASRWDAIEMLGRDGRTVKAREVRQSARHYPISPPTTFSRFCMDCQCGGWRDGEWTTGVFERIRKVEKKLAAIIARAERPIVYPINRDEALWLTSRLAAVLITIQDAQVTYGIVDADREPVQPLSPMMVERDAVVEALYGER